jgi:hypothetical protein
VNAELLAAAKVALQYADEGYVLMASRRERLRDAIARAEAAQGVEPNGGEESVGVTRTCACEPMCGYECAQCSEVRT